MPTNLLLCKRINSLTWIPEIVCKIFVYVHVGGAKNHSIHQIYKRFYKPGKVIWLIWKIHLERDWSLRPCLWGYTMILEKTMAPHSSTLAWKIPWMEEPGRLQSMGLLGVGHDWATSLSLFTFMHWRRKWQPTPVFLPGESQGCREPGGLPSMGSHRVGHDWYDLAAAWGWW